MRDIEEIESTTERQGDTVIIKPQGEIDLSRASSFRNLLAQAIDDADARVVVDLRQVPYMDSSGLATLVEAMQLSRRTDTRLVLFGLQEKVRSIFEIARLDAIFTITETQDDAVVA